MTSNNCIEITRADDGIVTLTIAMDGPANVINEAFIEDFAAAVAGLEAEEGLSGVIVTSGREHFVLGGDIDMLFALKPGDEARVFSMLTRLKDGKRRLERLPVPVVAALNGTALGGGYELALACNRRIAVDRADLRIGLPEVGLGLLPGGGGLVRLVQLLGLEAAMPFLLEGKRLAPAQALKAGLIDEVVPDTDALMARARAWIGEVAGDAEAAAQPWDRKGHRIPGGSANSPANAGKIAAGAAMLYRKTLGLQPAPAHILDVMVEAAGRLDLDSALRYESRRFVSLVNRPETKNMISALHYDMRRVARGEGRPAEIAPTQVKRLGVIGAGMMGHGIAWSAARTGLEVVLADRSPEDAARGVAACKALADKRVARGRMDRAEADAIVARIQPTAEPRDLAGCDMVIEAVFEKLDVKDAVLARHEPLLEAGAVWASNTSTLPITRLAESAQRPENFVGLHFFSPVDRMRLVEIIRGEKTSEETLARAFDFVRQIGKLPVLVRDAPGFFTSRVINTKAAEALEMVWEGLDPARIENLGRQAGFPVGMLTLVDEIGLTLPVDIFDTNVAMGLIRAEDDPTPGARALMREMAFTLDRKGKAAGGGFFDYRPDGGKTLWPGLARWRREGHAIPDADIRDRMLFRAVIESLRCLEEGVIEHACDGNIASLLGISAPMHTGGYIQFVNTYGLDRFVARCDELAAAYGPRFAAPDIARRHAETGEPIR